MDNRRRTRSLFAVSVISGLAAWVLFAHEAESDVTDLGPGVRAYELAAPIEAWQPVGPEQIAAMELPADALPDRAVTRPSEVIGMVSPVTLDTGTLLQSGMLVAPPTVTEGMREISIMVDADAGVGGNISPGSSVDVHATFPGSQDSRATAEVVVESALVVRVGVVVDAGGRTDGGFDTGGRMVPVSFLLDPWDALAVTYAEAFASSVRLALVAPGDKSEGGVYSRSPSGEAVLSDASVAAEVAE